MTSRSLWSLAVEFDNRLKSLKKRTPLEGLSWYPWDSLAALEILDQFLGGDPEALRAKIGNLPVLDVGCGDGDVAFFLESLGAQVDAVDNAPTNYNAFFGARKLRSVLESNIGIHAVDLDTHPNLPCSRYGLTIMLGVLYHLKNPFLVLETLARHSRHMFVSTRIASLAPDRKRSFGALPVAYLVDDTELNNDPTNFWIFSEEGLKRVLRRSGWNVLQFATVGPPAASADPVSPEGDVRAYVLAESRFPPHPFDVHIRDGWHDLEYDSWRWTERRFSAELDVSTPLSPATLRLQFHLPDPAIARRPEVTVSATVNGDCLPPAVFSTAGEHEYVGIVPNLAKGKAIINFELSAAIGPDQDDQRELGVLVDFSGAFPIQFA